MCDLEKVLNFIKKLEQERSDCKTTSTEKKCIEGCRSTIASIERLAEDIESDLKVKLWNYVLVNKQQAAVELSSGHFRSGVVKKSKIFNFCLVALLTTNCFFHPNL